MNAAIHNPYLDTLGGGERYTLSFARVLLDMGYSVDLEWNDPQIKKKSEKRFGIKLNEVNVVSDIKRGDGYDLCFWVSDGSVPTLRARKNLLHFQVPFRNVNGNSLLNKMKMFRIESVICNSEFTKKIIDTEFGVKSVVIYPPVSTDQIKSKHKENMILAVGRFSQLLQSKHQDVLVTVYKKMVDSGVKDWRLVLAGGVEVGSNYFLQKLKKEIENYPIEIVESPDFNTIKDLFGKARIFWSASGYGEDENKTPEKVEHFGISVVEAMATGAVPVVFNAGGHKEIVTNEVTGFLWNKKSELRGVTRRLISDKKYLRKISLESLSASKRFGLNRFKSDVEKVL